VAARGIPRRVRSSRCGPIRRPISGRQRSLSDLAGRKPRSRLSFAGSKS